MSDCLSIQWHKKKTNCTYLEETDKIFDFLNNKKKCITPTIYKLTITKLTPIDNFFLFANTIWSACGTITD